MASAPPTLLGKGEPITLSRASLQTEVYEQSPHTEESAIYVENGARRPDLIKTATLREMLHLTSRGELATLMTGMVNAILCGVAYPVANLLIMDLAAEMIYIEDYTEPESTMLARMWPPMLRLLILCLAWDTAGGIQAFCFRSFRTSQTAKVRSEYFTALISRDMEWYDMNPTPLVALPNQLASDVELLADAFGDMTASLITSSASIVASYIIGYIVGWQISLLLTGAMPGMAMAHVATARVVHKVQTGAQGHYATASATVEETFYAMRTVIALGYESRAIASFEVAMGRVRRLGIRKGVQRGITLGFTWALLILTYAVCFYFGMLLIYNRIRNYRTGDVFTGEDILTAFLCVFTGTSMIGSIDPGLQAVHRGRFAMGRYLSVRDNETSIQRGGRRQDDRTVCKQIQTISMEEVFFSYPSRPGVSVLNNVSLIIQRGQKVAFVGESGCGKSTLIALIERFYDPTQGVIKVNGEDLRSYSSTSVRSHMGYVGQEPVLFDGTLRENVKMGNPDASEEEFEQALEQAECWFVKALPGRVECAVGASGSQLSGGQRQRIAIARALIRNPSVLLLDEATSALDNKSEKLIQSTLDQYAKIKGGELTTISIAHRLNTIRGCDCIYYFKQGVVLERGTHRQLMARMGAYFELAESQVSSLDFEVEDKSGAEDEEYHSDDSEFRRPASFDTFLNIGPNRNTAIISKESKLKWVNGHYSFAKGGDASVVNGTQSVTSLSDEIRPDLFRPPPTRPKRVLRRLLAYCERERWLLVPVCFCAGVTGGVHPLVGVFIIQSLVAFYDPNVENMRSKITVIVIIYIAVSLLVMIANTVMFGLMGVIAESMVKRLRVAMLRTIMRMEMGFHDDPRHSAAMLANHLQVLPYRVSVLTDQMGSNFGTGGALVVGVVWALILCWQITLAVLISIPLLLGAAFISISLMTNATREESQKLSSCMQWINDCIVNPRTVQSLGIEELSLRIFGKRLQEGRFKTLWTRVLAAALQGFTSGLMIFLITLSMLLVVALIRGGYSTFLEANSALMAVLYGATGAGAMTATLGDTTKAKEAALEIFELLDRQSLIDGLDPTGAVPPAGFRAGDIEFKAVFFAYPFRPRVSVLRNMSFKVAAGQSIGLVGPSGCGKSTVLALIQRFYDPVEGTLYVGQHQQALKDINIRWWREQIGFVGQEPVLFNCSVLQNIKYGLPEGLELSAEKLRMYKEMACLQFLFDRNGPGWDMEVGVKGSRLSGGQKQRVAICRALVRNPQILMLDEATSALDGRSERIVQRALEAARSGRTSFSIAHRLSTVEDCDVILVLADGRVYEQGNDSELMMMEGLYAKLQEAQGKRTFAAC